MEQKRSDKKPSVLIAGAGPTGLILALWLRKKSIPFRLIDKAPRPGTTSRALAVQARTLEFYRLFGLADRLIDAGVIAKDIVLRRRGKTVATARFGALGKGITVFPYLLFCSQDVHEALLCEELKKLGVEVERNTEILSLEQNSQGVVAQIKGPNGIEDVSVSYLCGTDGAHSVVRHKLPTGFPGGTYSQVFFVADVMAEGSMMEGGVQISVSTKDFCIVMPIKSQGSVRLTGLVPPENVDKEKITYEDVHASVAANTGLSVKEVRWFSPYHVHHRVADNFHKGRVFLSGDAAHIHSPAGGQGMNTGIGDAINLAWKLAEVIEGRADERLLATYEIERRAFAKVLVKTTDTAFQIIASQAWLGSIFRAYLLPTIFGMLTRFKFFLNLAFRTISQNRIHYRMSPLSEGKLGKLQAGDRLPWFSVDGQDNYQALESLSWQIHIYGSASSSLKKSLQIPVQEFPWTPEAQRKEFRENALYLIRPDAHIAFISESQDPDSVKSYLQRKGLAL